MPRLYNKFWVNVTIVLSLIFIILGFPIFQRKYGFISAFIFTFISVSVIWIVYLIRAYIFSTFENESNKREHWWSSSTKLCYLNFSNFNFTYRVRSIFFSKCGNYKGEDRKNQVENKNNSFKFKMRTRSKPSLLPRTGINHTQLLKVLPNSHLQNIQLSPEETWGKNALVSSFKPSFFYYLSIILAQGIIFLFY